MVATGLTTLDIIKPFCFKDRGYSSLASLTNLQELHIGWSWSLGSRAEGLDFLGHLSRLRCLAITKCFVSDIDLRVIGKLTNLEILAISLCHNVDGRVFEYLWPLQKLQALDLEGSNMLASHSLEHLRAISGLQHLNLVC